MRTDMALCRNAAAANSVIEIPSDESAFCMLQLAGNPPVCIPTGAEIIVRWVKDRRLLPRTINPSCGTGFC
jgi:hypothetical protein